MLHSSPWLTIVVLLAVVGVLRALERVFLRSRSCYRSREFLLSQTERRFASALDAALPPGVRACPQVRLWDVIDAPRDSSWRVATNRIRAKHVDFVLIETNTSRILAAVELDDRSHDREDRRERDRFLDGALASAGIPLLRVPAERSYDPKTLLRPISTALNRAGRAA